MFSKERFVNKEQCHRPLQNQKVFIKKISQDLAMGLLLITTVPKTNFDPVCQHVSNLVMNFLVSIDSVVILVAQRGASKDSILRTCRTRYACFGTAEVAASSSKFPQWSEI